jgi:TetR/AcrR family transcriptional repressor of nem operon
MPSMTSATPLPTTDRTGPGRPREFDLDDAVRDAIEVFKAHGYHGTSVQDLTDGMGLARGSLYKAFHDKRALFLAALDQYTAAVLQRISDTLNVPGSARVAIRETLVAYAKRVSGKGPQGCIVTGAAMELVPDDEEVAAIIDRLFRRTRDLFAAAIIRGQAAGEIPRDHDERAIARQLHCTMQGLRVLGRTGPSEQDMTDIVDQALRSLD